MTSLIGGSPSQVPTNNQLARTAFIEPEDLPVPLSVEEELALKEDTIVAGTTAEYLRGDKQWADFETAVLNTNTGYPPFRPVFDANFLAAGQVDPRITFTRAGKSWRIVNGVLREYDVNEPCLTDDGWSVRPAETNLVYPSEDFTSARWAKARSTIVPAAATGPDGESGSASKLVGTSVGGDHGLVGPTFSITPGKFTNSLFLKAAEYRYAYLWMDNGSGLCTTIEIDLLTGSTRTTYTVGSYSGIGVKIDPMAAGWWRAALTATTALAAVTIRVYCSPDPWVSGNYGTPTFTGDDTSGIYIFGAQINPGDPIPYIPTTSAAVTRPADSASIQGDAFASVWNPMEGAIIFDVTQPAFHPASNGWMVGLSDGTLDNTGIAGFYNRPADSNFNFLGKAIIGPTIPPGTRIRGGLRWEDSAWSAALNGAVLDTKSIVGDPANLNQLWIGGLMAGNSLKAIVNVHRLTIFDRRPTDSQMEALTS